MSDLIEQTKAALEACGVDLASLSGDLTARNPIDGKDLLNVPKHSGHDVAEAVEKAEAAFPAWRDTPAPVRGQTVKRWGELLAEYKKDLAFLVQVDAGKITSEAEGEVQEMIDICEFALGQSRMLYGKTMPSERPGHRLMETWHPLGVVGIITAFNFPVAPYSWNTANALVAGDTVVWKPSEIATLSALATDALLARAVKETGAPEGIHQIVLTDREGGEALVDNPKVKLVSATGSTRMGREVGPRVAQRFGKCLLELGGNNAAIVSDKADLELTLRGAAFSAAGTAGQRCTTLRRLIVHESVADQLTEKLVAAYKTLSIGDPREEGILVGPLIHEGAYEGMQKALAAAKDQGGEVLVGGSRVLEDEYPDAFYVEPAIVKMPGQTEVVTQETFAPILYVLTYKTLDEAIELHNSVPQGLSSSIFTEDQREAELFLSAAGSDCGIANVNIGTSGAEIGGAFGGEKETGGGRESGSDAWKAYMRRATNTVNYSGELPLAQGVEFI
ncbi:aldehyde dehydrogenase family protein [Nesterenkonia sp. MY13]|uniref:aldehyde dehydrogenase (NAD(+)) n=1 Tax=Nesterenkonia sedimenti TaxID=1463632 RepID=A0A7X8TJK9_9MICC|nr:aldehyde dehydrogenase family protein [Nesterenkonia sedimenti]NLS09557.1 aldehyde dehydrogenase family protein [Nesterenkonia sedimenti]